MSLRVSVVIAVYNGAPYLRKALDSALNQTYPPHEVIVIDDGSMDETPKTLESYGRRIVMRRFENAGVATAMNRGLELAGGDAVAFLDHDDVWFRNKLEKQVEALLRYPEAGFVCCDYAVRPPGGGGRMIKHFPTMRSLKGLNAADPFLKDSLRYLIQENFVGTSSAVMIRREVIQKVGLFNKNYRISGDYDYWLRCVAVADFVAVPEVLFYKRTHATNLSGDRTRTLLEQRDIMVSFFKSHRDCFEKSRVVDSYRREIAALHFVLGNLCFEKKQFAEAFSFYGAALRCRRSVSNLLVFLWTVTKKSVRLLTFDIISRKSLLRKGA